MTPEKRPQDPYMDGSGKHNICSESAAIEAAEENAN
jgi:hypothetical protein